MKCPKCKKTTKHKHRHDTAYGFCHHVGSERYECCVCGYAMYIKEGTKQSLKYTLDTPDYSNEY